MRAEDINLDQLVDYKTEYCSIIKKSKISGDNLTGLCPFHDDTNNSFSVDLKTGRWKCHAEDRGGNFTSFYAEINGMDTKEAYKEILKKYDAYEIKDGKVKKDETSQLTLTTYTVPQYSFEKHLPEEWLIKQCRVQTGKDKNGIQYLYIPYFNETGREVTYRKRYANKQFRWKYGAGKNICMYGEWKLEKIRNAGYVYTVHGRWKPYEVQGMPYLLKENQTAKVCGTWE